MRCPCWPWLTSLSRSSEPRCVCSVLSTIRESHSLGPHPVLLCRCCGRLQSSCQAPSSPPRSCITHYLGPEQPHLGICNVAPMASLNPCSLRCLPRQLAHQLKALLLSTQQPPSRGLPPLPSLVQVLGSPWPISSDWAQIQQRSSSLCTSVNSTLV